MSLSKDIYNTLLERLNEKRIGNTKKFNGDYLFYNDRNGNLTIIEPDLINPFKVKETQINPTMFVGVSDEKQPYKDRKMHFFNGDLRIVFRVEDKDDTIDTIESFAESFDDDVIVVNGIKFNFLISNGSSFQPTQLHGGEWLMFYSTQVKLATGKDIEFAEEGTIELSDDNDTFEVIPDATFSDSRNLVLENTEMRQEDSSVNVEVRNAYSITLSYIYNPNSQIQKDIRTSLKNPTVTRILYVRVTEKDNDTKTYKMLLEGNTRNKNKGQPIGYSLILKESL